MNNIFVPLKGTKDPCHCSLKFPDNGNYPVCCSLVNVWCICNWPIPLLPSDLTTHCPATPSRPSFGKPPHFTSADELETWFAASKRTHL